MFLRAHRRRYLRLISVWVIVAQVLALSPAAYANPRGGSVAAGQVSISETGATMNVNQMTDKAIVNWQSFSNAAGETVRFNQPASSSVILNRVTGANGSVIEGAMSANGKVFLLNPNGIIFGRTANINTGGLVASTLQMKDEDFLAGKYKLQQDPAKPLRAVVNQGTINAAAGGEVALVAPLVNNEGTINAPSGRVALAAGTKATVTLDEQGLVSLGVRDEAPGTVVVSKSAVSPMLEQAVNNRHIVDAGTVIENANGEIELGSAEGVAMNQGTINVNAAAGQNAGRARIDSTQATIATPGSLISADRKSVV